MPWFKVDDSFPTHPKVLKIPRRDRVAAIGLWTLAGAWCAHHLTNGALDSGLVEEFGGTAKAARSLVDAELWDVTETGFIFHDWPEWQPTKEETLELRRVKAEAGRQGGLAAARSKRLARATAPAKHLLDESLAAAIPPSRPDPFPTKSTMAEVVPHLNGSGDVRDDLVDLEQIARATRGDHAHAQRVARDVLSKARTKVADPTAFVLTAVRADPARHRANAPTTGARCAEHFMDLPCQACASERKAAR